MENSLHKQASDAFKQMIRIYIDVQGGVKEFKNEEQKASFFYVYSLFKADHLIVATGLDDAERKAVAQRMKDRADYYKSQLTDKFVPFGASVRSMVG